MKKLAIVLMLALPAVAFGGASLSLTSGGLNAINVTPGSVFTLNASVATDAVFNTLGAQLNASANNVFSVQSTGWTFALASTTPTFFDPNRFDPAALDLSLPVALGTQALYDTTFIYPDLGFQKSSGNYTVATFPLTVWSIPISVAAGAKPGVYELIPGNADFVTSVGGAVASSFSGLQITITPEPATMLLLAGALPFLRRRSA